MRCLISLMWRELWWWLGWQKFVFNCSYQPRFSAFIKLPCFPYPPFHLAFLFLLIMGLSNKKYWVVFHSSLLFLKIQTLSGAFIIFFTFVMPCASLPHPGNLVFICIATTLYWVQSSSLFHSLLLSIPSSSSSFSKLSNIDHFKFYQIELGPDHSLAP